MNYTFLKGGVPCRHPMVFYNSQLIRFARVSSHVHDFNTRNKVLTAKLLKRGYRYHKFGFNRFFFHFVNCNIHIHNIVYSTNGIRTKPERLYSSSP